MTSRLSTNMSGILEPESCFFTKAPSEIRNEIYKFVFSSSHWNLVTVGMKDGRLYLHNLDRNSLHAQVLRVNKALLAEAAPAFWESLTLSWTHCAFLLESVSMLRLTRARQESNRMAKSLQNSFTEFDVFRSICLSIYKDRQLLVEPEGHALLVHSLFQDFAAAGFTNLKNLCIYLVFRGIRPAALDGAIPLESYERTFRRDFATALSEEMKLPIAKDDPFYGLSRGIYVYESG